jgi:hypothetical protein
MLIEAFASDDSLYHRNIRTSEDLREAFESIHVLTFNLLQSNVLVRRVPCWLCLDLNQRYFIHYLKWYAEYRHEVVYAGKVFLDEPCQEN